MKHNNYRRIPAIAWFHPYSIKKPRLKLKRYRCPKCQKYMLWHKWYKKYWWCCSNEHCSFNAPDERYMPKILTPEQAENLFFINQLEYLLFTPQIGGDPRTRILVRVIKKKGLDALPQKFVRLYHKLIEPIRTSISFVPCRACSRVLNKNDSDESLHVGNGEYLCVACFSY